MPIKSYIVATLPGQAESFAAQVSAIPGCSSLPAQNRDALILVTDTPSESAEEQTRLALEQLPALLSLTLVSAFDTPDDLVQIDRKVPQ